MKLTSRKMLLPFIVSVLLLIGPKTLLAREIILIENQATTEEGMLVKNILMKKFHLPKEIITLKNIKMPCEKKSLAIMHLCLLENGDLLVVQMNHYVVRNSLGVFLNEESDKGGIQ